MRTSRGTAFAETSCVLALAAILWGCGPAKLSVRPVRYELDVRLDPATHTLAGEASLELERLDETERERGALELKLHPELSVAAIDADGGTIRSHRTRSGSTDEDGSITPSTHRLIVDGPAGEIRLSLRYDGELFQDTEAGEEEGQVHNFVMAAHVGDDGIYLDSDGYWYPMVDMPDDADPDLSLSGFTLTTDRVEGFELVAGLESDPSAPDGRLRWTSPFPLDSLVLLGGPLTRWSSRHGDIELHAVLDPSKGEVAKDVLAASAEYLERYERLIGPYPFREFTVLEAFFSSGFAFPTCTQIAGSQISQYKQYRRHGYLDHELLHNWWGNGVFVHPDDGNWCEALASYMGNYYGHVLDGDEAGARRERRNNSNFLSAIEPDKDKPLGTFGQEDGVGRGVGYMKGSAVFHMLERKLGADALFAGLERFAGEWTGKHADWSDLREALEHDSDVDLELFFDQWVRRGGAPLLELVDARWTPGSDELTVTLSQGETDFALDVPLRLHYGDRNEDVVITLVAPEDEIVVAVEPSGLTAVELDPDYHVFRKLKPVETMPTSSLTRRAETLVIVTPEGELADGYQTVVDSYSRSVLGDEDEPKAGHEVLRRDAATVTAEDLGAGSVLVVGDSVRAPAVEAFLRRTTGPVEWNDEGFRVETDDYSGPGQAVFFTVHHPDREDSGVTVYFGNSPAALSNARVLSYYPNSLLVFDTPITDEADEDTGGMPRAKVLRRIDFESHDRIDL